MRARLAFGLVVILAVGAIAGWRLASPAATATQTITKPHATVTHSAPGALATGTVSVSYMISAVVSSPKAAISVEPVRICTNGPMKPR